MADRGSNELEEPNRESAQPSTKHVQLGTENGPRRGDRLRRAPAHLSDYLCYGATPQDLSLTNNSKKGSSGMAYPMINYVTCTNFSEKYQKFLAAITKIVEPVFYHEAAKDPLWREAMKEEIQALE